MEELSRSFDQMNFQQDEKLPLSARACLVQLIQQVEEEKLRQGLNVELKRLLIDHERLVSMLQQRSQLLEQENEHLKTLNDEHQRRYEKAVREMQFFKNKYDNLKKEHHHHHPSPPPPPPPPQQQQPLPPPPPSQQQQQHLSHGLLASYPLTPTSPQPSTISYDSAASQHHPPPRATLPSRSSSASTNSSSSLGLHHLQQQQKQQQQHQQQHGTAASYWPAPPASVVSTESSSTATSGHIPAEPMLRQQPSHPVRHAGTQSIYSVESSFSDRVNNNSNWRPLQHNPSIHSSYSSPSTVSTMSSAAGGPGGSSSSTGTSVYSVPMTPVRSTTSANGYTGSSMIQQRRVDPLLFGGSDALWDTIAKSKGSDVTVEKIISNFLRRGGSPNTAKQSPSTGAVKYGYGMIHALVVTKASGALDLLLQQGANPNAMTLSQNEDDKVSPCYVAASVGWLAGLQKLVQAGADLINARGQGSKSKTALHTAAEHCHAAVVEFIVGYTEGALNLITDSQGATALHYACASGHTHLVGFFARSCHIPVDQPDDRGEQPIHWAAKNGRLEVVTMLVERFGCDFNAYVSKKVPTPLEMAKSGNHKRLVDYLKGLGALTAKKLDKKREEEKSKQVPHHLTNTLARNGLLGGDDGGFF